MTDARGGFVTGPMYEALRAERDRLAERLDSAIARNESLIEQREAERAAAHRVRIEAAYGRALLRLVEQIRRLRRAADAYRVPFDMDRMSVADAVRGEIDEVMSETEGSEAEAHEIIDALGATLQMFVGAGHGDAELLVKLTAGGERLAERIDLIDCGMTWDLAKRAQRSKHHDMPGALAAVIDAPDKQTRAAAVGVVVEIVAWGPKP